MVAIGLIASSILYFYNSKNIGDSKYRKEDTIIYIGLSFLVGIAFSNIGNWYIYSEFDKFNIFQKIIYAGYTFYFGLIVFIITFYIILELSGYNTYIYINEIVPSITLFHSIGRIGCLLGGCCYGNICNTTVLSVLFVRFPIREIEIIFLLTLTLIFQKFIKKNRLIIYLLCYSVFRFFIEFKRGDNRGRLFTDFYSPSQEISLIIILTCIMTIIYNKANKWVLLKKL